MLHALTKGLSNKEIADFLSVTVETVRWHLKHIYDKLYVHGRTLAALKFMKAMASYSKPTAKPTPRLMAS